MILATEEIAKLHACNCIHVLPIRSGYKCRTNPFPVGEGGDAVAAGGEVSETIAPPHRICH